MKADLFKLDNLSPLLPMALAAIVVAVTRLLWWQYLIGLRRPLGPMGIDLVCFPFLILLMAFLPILSALVFRSIRKTHSIIPTAFLVVALFLAFQIPLPERPPPPEMLHFLEHREDYEAVVELARNDELEVALPDCRAGFRPPEALKHVSAAGCMFVEEYRDRGLVVFFNPLDPFYHPVAYVEFDEVEYPCGFDPFVEQKIDDHWYVCVHDWN